MRVVQRECFHEEYVALKGGGQVKSNSKLANLSPILVNDVIRVGGRIHRAPIAFEESPGVHVDSSLLPSYPGTFWSRACVVCGTSVLLDIES